MAPLPTCFGCGLPPHRAPDTGRHIPMKQCQRCRAAVYHNEACQRQHYAIHKQTCRRGAAKPGKGPPFTVEPLHGRGQGCVATRVMRLGEEIVSTTGEHDCLVPPVPFVHARTSCCAYCFARLQANHLELPSCPVYTIKCCSRECAVPSLIREGNMARLLWQEIATNGSRPPPGWLPTMILVFRVIMAMVDSERESTIYSDLQELWAPTDEPERDTDAQAHGVITLQLTSQLFRILLQTLPKDPPELQLSRASSLLTINGVCRLIRQIQLNSFTITDGDGESIGIGLYRVAHRFNHSCQPEAIQNFQLGTPGCCPRLLITVNCPKIDKGQELCIAYIDTSLPRERRQKALCVGYGFHCQCPRCLSEE
jgi:MYND finger